MPERPGGENAPTLNASSGTQAEDLGAKRPEDRARPRRSGALKALLREPRVWIAAGAWLLTRALVVAEVGFWHRSGHFRLEDVGTYHRWSDQLAAGHLPSGHAWQYPPGAGFVMFVPRLGPGSYGASFVGLMLLFDLVCLGLLWLLAMRRGNWTGVWVWLFGIPFIGVFSILRFDLVPTAIAIAALMVIHLRPRWFGALAGIGAAIKVWPIVLLFGEWDRRRLGRASIAALLAALALVIASAIAFGDPFGALSAQGGRGLQEESVATIPWQLGQIITGVPFHRSLEFGSWQIDTAGARALSRGLEALSLAVLLASAAWWWLRARAIRGGDEALGRDDVSRDFVFAVVLLLVVTSRVLSPQYMVWLLGLAAVILTAGTTRMARPAAIVVGAVLLTTATFRSPEITLLRDLLLLVAAADASVALALRVRRHLPHRDRATPTFR
jgi:hypothetical protein